MLSVLYRFQYHAGHFYEWDRTKTKVTFSGASDGENSSLYMAGFYNYFHIDQGFDDRTGKRGGIDEFRFIILTTGANESMKPVHDRMPLILPENQIRDWIFDDGLVGEILEQSSPMLSRYQEYEQLTLF
ncbi:MAG: SOS response-associated peptidase family protein [Lachnospiraceae bacterium]|nr:SOS response-associated peptidase family protein [Lachnospiraceae bacterium]